MFVNTWPQSAQEAELQALAISGFLLFDSLIKMSFSFLSFTLSMVTIYICWSGGIWSCWRRIPDTFPSGPSLPSSTPYWSARWPWSISPPSFPPRSYSTATTCFGNYGNERKKGHLNVFQISDLLYVPTTCSASSSSTSSTALLSLSRWSSHGKRSRRKNQPRVFQMCRKEFHWSPDVMCSSLLCQGRLVTHLPHLLRHFPKEKSE